ncbi:MAG TPA: hypothetical protein VHE81_18070 [Lacipirellulaceae bacterium]|nr:hypothetical protein [Lacipirellulaceae bacterium]
MSQQTIEDRLAILESRYTELLDLLRNRPAKGAWRGVVGMFADDPQIDELHREIRRIREEDRAATRQGES